MWLRHRGFRRLRTAGACGPGHDGFRPRNGDRILWPRPRRPKGVSFCEKKSPLGTQRKFGLHRQGSNFSYRRASGYSQYIHRPLPLPFCLKKCQHPHWAATAPLIAAPAAREVAQSHRNSTKAAAAERGASRVVRQHGGNRRRHYTDGLLFLWKSKRLFFFAKKKSRLAPAVERRVPRPPQWAKAQGWSFKPNR